MGNQIITFSIIFMSIYISGDEEQDHTDVSDDEAFSSEQQVTRQYHTETRVTLIKHGNIIM